MPEDLYFVSPAGALTLFTEFNRQFPGRLLEFGPIDTGPSGDDFAVRGFDPVTALNFDFRVTADGNTSSFAFFPNPPNPFTEPPAPESDPGPDAFEYWNFTPQYAPPGLEFARFDDPFGGGGPINLFFGTAFFGSFGHGGGGYDSRPYYASTFTEDIEDQENYGFDDGIW